MMRKAKPLPGRITPKKPIIMNKFDRFLNSLSDSGPLWSPFPFVRIEKHERIDDLRILIHTPVFGTMMGLGPILTYMLMTASAVPPEYTIGTLGMSMAGFFIGYKLTFARSWNLRAELLRKSAEAGLLNITAFRTSGAGSPAGSGPRGTPIPFKPSSRPPGKSVA